MAEYLKFVLLDKPVNRKTNTWMVAPKFGTSNLGEIKFHPAWRRFCFFPFPARLFDKDCLRSVADFCEAKTIEWRRR